MRDSCGFREGRRQQTNQQAFESITKSLQMCRGDDCDSDDSATAKYTTTPLRDFPRINGQPRLPLSQASIPEMPSFSRNHPHEATTRFSTQPDPSNVYSYHQDPLPSHHISHFPASQHTPPYPSPSPPPRSRHKQPSSIQPSGYPTFKELVATSFLPLQPPVVVRRRTDCAVDERTTCLLMSCDARASR